MDAAAGLGLGKKKGFIVDSQRRSAAPFILVQMRIGCQDPSFSHPPLLASVVLCIREERASRNWFLFRVPFAIETRQLLKGI